MNILRKKDEEKAASIAVFSHGKILLGKRRDNSLWTLPAGHLLPNEEPLEGALRELKEETGLEPSPEDVEYLGEGTAKNGKVLVYAFCVEMEGAPAPTGENDPDEECSQFKWYSPDEIPEDKDLHVPRKHNVTLKLLDGESLIKSVPCWQSKDGLQIPIHGSNERKDWENELKQAVAEHFAGGDISKVKNSLIPLSQIEYNTPVTSEDRLKLYTRMLQGGEPLPPVVVQKTGNGYSVLDGNHRLSAAHRAGLENIPVYEIDTLEKNLKSLIAAGAVALFPAIAHAPESAGIPLKHIEEVIHKIEMPQWSLDGLHKDLIPVAELESHFGTNTNHQPHSKGDYNTAFGAIGMKPVTAHEEWTHSKKLQSLYPGLADPSDFIKKFKADPRFYNLVGSSHFLRLKARHGSPARAAYAWRHGTGACSAADDEQVSSDPYVQKYVHLAAKLLNKSEDGIRALLHVDHPVDRRLALKSHNIEPHHLKIALQDEDPHVRVQAAMHPKLTPELIMDVLTGKDKWLKEEVLKRADLRPEQLEEAFKDKSLWPHILNHIALTPALKDKMAAAQQPDTEAHEVLIQKNIGYLTFPQLGETQVPSLPVVATHEALERRYKLHGTAGAKFAGQKGITMYNRRRQNPTSNPYLIQMVVGQKEPAVNEVHHRLVSRGVAATASEVAQITGDKATNGLLGHEAQHGVFARLRQKYGNEAGHRIVARTLSALEPKDHKILQHFYSGTRINEGPLGDPEESIAYMHNYLQDPAFRKKIHMNLRIHKDVKAQRNLASNLRKIWEKLRVSAQNVKLEDVGVTVKKFEEELELWTKSEATPSSDVLEQHLGIDGSLLQYIDAASFLTGKNVSMYDIRRALKACDGDVRQAICVVYGIESKEDLEALDAVLQIEELDKSETEGPKEIKALTPSGQDVAKDIESAYRLGEVKPIKLRGKHSTGTLLAEDEDGVYWLLKYGSGKNSPAAGIRQEAASQSRREAAFYAVAEKWFLGPYVPRAELLAIDGREVAAIKMLPFSWQNLAKVGKLDPTMPFRALEKYRDMGVLHRWAVLDGTLGNSDRHGNNLMVSPVADGSKIALIDHGSTFAGSAFDPAHDEDSFIPYYLRVWVPEWNKKTVEERFNALPTISSPIEEGLKNWISNLDELELKSILLKYGINPEPSLNRLKHLKNLVKNENSVTVLNKIWAGLYSWGNDNPEK